MNPNRLECCDRAMTGSAIHARNRADAREARSGTRSATQGHMAIETIRKYKKTIQRGECDNFGAINYTITETLTARDGGIHVVTHAVGKCESTPVDQRSECFFPAVTMDRAEAYRIRNGYHLVNE